MNINVLLFSIDLINKNINETLEKYFDTFFYSNNENDFFELFKKNKINMVIVDIENPTENIINLLQKLRIEAPKIPLLILSNLTDSDFFIKCIKLKITSFILKPINHIDFIAEIKEQINKIKNYKEAKNNKLLLSQYKDTVDKSFIVSKTDPKGIITYVNEEFCNISGYTKDELIGTSHNIIRHHDSRKEIFEDLWYQIKILKRTWTGQIKNKKKNGESYWVKTIINPILDSTNNVVEYIAVRTDITEQIMLRKNIESELNKSTKDLKQAIKLSNEYKTAINNSTILSRCTLDGKIIYVNDKFCEVSGYTKKELIGKNHNINRHPDTPNEIYHELWTNIEHGKIWRGIFKNLNKNKNDYWVDTTIVPIKDENNNIIEYMAIRHNLSELFNLHKEIEETQKEIVYRLGEIGETRSAETGNHVKRVALYSKILAKLYGLDEHEINILYTASPMHDIGKVGIADNILKKPSKLTIDEFEIMKTHSKIGYNILKNSNRAVLKAAAIISHEHHEKWDGTGYPRGLKGEEIHIYGRITAIADVFDALGSDRYYKKAWNDEAIFEYLKDKKAKDFDPYLIDLFFDNFSLFEDVRKKYKN